MHKIYRRFIMKKIFALILVVLMLIPFVASCRTDNGDDNTDTPTNTSTNTNTNTDTSTNTDTNTNTGTDTSTNTDTDTDTNTGKPSTGKTPQEEIDAIKDSFGDELNVLASGVFSQSSTDEGAFAPWGQVELCILDDAGRPTAVGNAQGFGSDIHLQTYNRQKYVEDTYGITVNYIDCGGAAMQGRLRIAAGNKDIGGEVIHIAMPRVLEAQAIVLDDSVYDINGSKYIDFDASYYNQEALDSYTLNDRTFFLAGDISFLDEHTSFVIFYNMEIASASDSFPDLYAQAHEGTWTIDTLYTLASAVSENIDGSQDYTDGDKYGFGTNGLSSFYQYFGVYQVSKKDTTDGETYTLSVRDDKVSTIIEKMIYANKNESWSRTNWKGGFGAMQAAFTDNRLLFYHEVIQKLDYLSEDPDLKTGLLPFPKLNVDQDRYYSPSASQATLICVPRATDDRDMSEAFIEILSSSASEYIMPAYMNMIKKKLTPAYAEASMRILEEEVFPNMMYDQGYMYEYGGLVSASIQMLSIEGGVNNFEAAYGNGAKKAEDILANWSLAYIIYEDEH